MTDLKETVLSLLPGDVNEAHIHCFDSIGSTNDHLKQLLRQGAPAGTAVIAAHQTDGHGRRGRSFHSPRGQGIYLSWLLRPDCLPEQLMHLTCAAAVAMCDAVEAAGGFRPGIKWTNDLVHGKRKLGGILTELGFEDGRVAWAIVGIGINCLQQPEDFPEELRDFAGSLTMVSGKPVQPEALAAAMLAELGRLDGLLADKAETLDRYRRDCVTIGQEICVIRGDAVRHGKALSLDEDGALVVAFSDGTVAAVNSGEVSIRGMYGYI